MFKHRTCCNTRSPVGNFVALYKSVEIFTRPKADLAFSGPYHGFHAKKRTVLLRKMRLILNHSMTFIWWDLKYQVQNCFSAHYAGHSGIITWGCIQRVMAVKCCNFTPTINSAPVKVNNRYATVKGHTGRWHSQFIRPFVWVCAHILGFRQTTVFFNAEHISWNFSYKVLW